MVGWLANHECPILEPAAPELADATSQPPLIYDSAWKAPRKVLDDVQATPIGKPDVDEVWITVRAEVGDVKIRIVEPVGASGDLPTILYVHGGGWRRSPVIPGVMELPAPGPHDASWVSRLTEP